MTKKDLERENKFLRLQLKIINELLAHDDDEQISACKYYSNAVEIQHQLDFIRENNCPYNFYHKLMKV